MNGYIGLGREAGEDIEQGLFVKFVDGATAVVCGAGEAADGVSTETMLEGQPISVAALGAVEVQIGASLAGADYVESDANGRAIPLVSGESNGLIKEHGVAPVGGQTAPRAEILIK